MRRHGMYKVYDAWAEHSNVGHRRTNSPLYSSQPTSLRSRLQHISRIYYLQGAIRNSLGNSKFPDVA
jgi:hypothetical protein